MPTATLHLSTHAQLQLTSTSTAAGCDHAGHTPGFREGPKVGSCPQAAQERGLYDRQQLCQLQALKRAVDGNGFWWCTLTHVSQQSPNKSLTGLALLSVVVLGCLLLPARCGVSWAGMMPVWQRQESVTASRHKPHYNAWPPRLFGGVQSLACPAEFVVLHL